MATAGLPDDLRRSSKGIAEGGWLEGASDVLGSADGLSDDAESMMEQQEA